jgi:hypothetical protein
MPVFERPYLKKNSTGHRSEPIFGVYDDEPLGICFEFFKPQIWVAGYQANRYGLEKIGMTGIFRSYGFSPRLFTRVIL